ncbi:MAG: multidrug effflux MFS transporter [bacterium]|nr:multidrug effflux MFS transporter [bacterium]
MMQRVKYLQLLNPKYKTVINTNIVLIILMFLNPISGIGIDINAPSLPYIVSGLHTNIALVQLILSIYVLGFGLGQIIVGNLSDSIGRKPVLIGGLIGVIITSVLAGLSVNIYFMLFMRFLQGITVSAPGNLSKSITTDYYTKEEITKVSTYITFAWGLGPIIAPAIGAYLQYHFDWRVSFYFFSAYCVVALILVLICLPETNKHKRSITINKVVNKHLHILSSKVFIGSALSMTIGYSIIIIFNTIGPFLIQDLLKYSVTFYGHIALLIGIAFTAGTFSNLIYIRYFTEHKILISGIIILIISSGIMLLFASSTYINIFIVLIPTLFIVYSIGCIYPHYMGKCISLFPKMAGAASSTSGCIIMVGTALIATVASLMKTNSLLPLAAIYFSLSLILCLLYFLFIRNNHNLINK